VVPLNFRVLCWCDCDDLTQTACSLLCLCRLRTVISLGLDAFLGLDCDDISCSLSCPTSQAWHQWALFNVAVMQHFHNRGDPDGALAHVAPAVKGFFKSVALGQASGDRTGNLQVCELSVLLAVAFHFWVTSRSTRTHSVIGQHRPAAAAVAAAKSKEGCRCNWLVCLADHPPPHMMSAPAALDSSITKGWKDHTFSPA
jgi:hypothetical protein